MGAARPGMTAVATGAVKGESLLRMVGRQTSHLGDPGPQSVGFGMAQLGVNVGGPLPDGARRGEVAGAAVDVAEPDQRRRHLIAVPQALPERERLLVRGDGLRGVTQLVMGVAEA